VAIGWGKSFEDQVEEGNQRLTPDERVPRLNKEDRVRSQRLESLMLSRSRVLDQFERYRHPAHRESLLKGLRAIEQEMEDLSRLHE
jgi:shikimate kinase